MTNKENLMRTYMATTDGRPIITQLNNGIINARGAMPLKDLTSDNNSSFELTRQIFNKSYQPPINYKTTPVGRSFFQRRAPAIEHGYVVDGPKSVQQKKWIGGNRDASQITANRRKNTTGQIMTFPGPRSFTNIKDNNTRIDALTRVRGGGATVPPKVASRPVTYYNGPTIIRYYRIVSAGLNAVTSGGSATNFVTYTSSTAYNVSPGIYNYTNALPTPVALYNVFPKGGFVRSYNILTIDRISGATSYRSFDVFGLLTNATAMANYLNSLTTSVIVVIATYDEPSTTNNDPGFTSQSIDATTPVNNTAFITAMKRCGAPSNFGNPVNFFYRSAYVLVGSPGIGTGNGLSRYAGANNGATGDAAAVVDLTIYYANGQYTYVSG